MKKYRNTIEFEVYGPYALFSDPVMRVGGEKTSYHIPTYEALRGIVESIYWKPTIMWIVDAVNRPRINMDGYGEISDVCIKRKIRNRLQDLGQKIFVQSDDRTDDPIPV